MVNKSICLDTGIITLYYSKGAPNTIDSLFNEIKQKNIPVFLSEMVLLEAYVKITQKSGKDFAQASLNNFIMTIPYGTISLEPELIQRAGDLKMQFIRKLSYIDCVSIAFCIQNQIVLHTTEKELPILNKLRIQTYNF